MKYINLIYAVLIMICSCKKNVDTAPIDSQKIALMGNSYLPIKYQEQITNSPVVYFNTNVLYIYRNDSLIVGEYKVKISPMGINENGQVKDGYTNENTSNHYYNDFTSYEYLTNDTILLGINQYSPRGRYKSNVWLVKI